MSKPSFLLKHVLIALGLVALAGLVRYGIAPLMEDLPADYASETHYAAESRLRDTATDEWQTIILIARRVDQSIVSVGHTASVQGDLHWATDTGQVIFENTGLYGVDRRTRMNVPGYGNTSRTGQFLFPLHVQRGTYTLWDPNFIGPRVATFDHTERVDGLPVYVFRFSGTGMDETEGYSYLPDVPERYRAYTDGQGTVWVEPGSGIVVDYEEQGASYVVDPKTGARVGDLFQWHDRYTPETRSAQLQLAAAAQRRIRILEDWLPGGLLLAGLVVWFVAGLWRRRKSRPREAAQVEPGAHDGESP